MEKRRGRTPTAPIEGGDALVPGMKHIRGTKADDLTAILLEHRYTEDGLGVAALKGDDRARAAALFAAAESAGMTARLALVSLHQMGELEGGDDSGYYGYRRRGGGGDEPDDGEMGEIYESTLTIDHWRTSTDRKENLAMR